MPRETQGNAFIYATAFQIVKFFSQRQESVFQAGSQVVRQRVFPESLISELCFFCLSITERERERESICVYMCMFVSLFSLLAYSRDPAPTSSLLDRHPSADSSSTITILTKYMEEKALNSYIKN